ncbi:hypothetical protein EJB05_35807 [Eragrostis curvula]|uniref:Uncharacterized protein n=2 Tax=Eragrostis curvula TaxID=38414 RepID=A0A5J9U7T8_9POAL|nr:hypothetical protein EJB05_35807 [Eragrostis curvula]
MDAKKKSPPATAAAGAGDGQAAANGYFSAYFPASPAGNAKDAKPADLIAMLNKQNSRGQNGSGIAGGKSQGRTTYKDGKHDPSESPYFGSSVHYGGRDFYNSSSQKQTTEPPRNYKEDDSDGSATRGDWWQGMVLPITLLLNNLLWPLLL